MHWLRECFVVCPFNWSLFVSLHLCSGSNEEGGRNQTETTGKIYHEQVSELFSVDSNIIMKSGCCLPHAHLFISTW